MSSNYSLTWTVHLARRQPRKAAIALVLILAASVSAGLGLQSWGLGALAVVVLLGAVRDYLLPINITINEAGINVRGLWHRRQMNWSQVSRVIRGEQGVKLSPFPRPSRLEAYRGIYVWFENNEAEVMAAIAHHMKEEAAGGDDRQFV